MERQANYMIVGAISIFIMIGALVFVVWLANFQFNQTWDHYRIYFRGPVSGLSKGGEVQFNGIKVGEITEIKLDEHDANRVLTDIEIQHGTPVHTDSFAQALALGITGVKYVQISPGSTNKGLLREVSRDKPPVIPARRGQLDNIVNDVSAMTASGAQALDRINRVLSDGNINNISTSIGDVQALTGELRSRKAMFANLDSATAKLDRAAGDLERTMATARVALGDDKSGVFAQIAGSTHDLRTAVGNLNSMLTKADGSMGELSTTTIPRATFAMESIQQAADRLDSLVFKLEQNPGLLLSSRRDREVEIPK